MQLKLFKTLWGFSGGFDKAVDDCLEDSFDGIEGPVPEDVRARSSLGELLHANKLLYVAEISTAGSYVPDRQATLQQHLESFRQKLDASLPLDPVFITCLGGCDAWSESQSIDFFSSAMDIARVNQVEVSFETHRGRSLYNPWTTRRIIDQVPDIKLTCDFSHWCVVCERLIDTEVDIIRQVARHAHHIHARIGYDQGPQVPHPAAPEYAKALQAHQRWWEIIWQSQQERGYETVTMTPEFGPDGYLHETPFSREPVADLRELNRWMAKEEKQHFKRFSG